MKEPLVYVRRERPTALAVSIALAMTMLVVYVLTLDALGPDVVESVSAAPRVTREIEFAGLRGYCLSLGAWDSADQARAEAADCADPSMAGRVCEIGGRWHILGVLYDTRKQASRMAEALEIPAEVVELTSEAVRMRITAPDRQIDLIVAADALLRDQIAQLSSIARQLEKGEIQSEAAMTLCALASSEAGAIAEKLSGIPGAAENGLCAALIDALADASARLEDIRSSGQSGAALSGLLRLAGIDAFLNLRDLQVGLTK